MYIHTYIHTYVRMYVCTYIHTYIRMYVCTYVRTYVCTYVRMSVCMHVCMYVRMYEPPGAIPFSFRTFLAVGRRSGVAAGKFSGPRSFSGDRGGGRRLAGGWPGSASQRGPPKGRSEAATLLSICYQTRYSPDTPPPRSFRTFLGDGRPRGFSDGEFWVCMYVCRYIHSYITLAIANTKPSAIH